MGSYEDPKTPRASADAALNHTHISGARVSFLEPPHAKYRSRSRLTHVDSAGELVQLSRTQQAGLGAGILSG